MHATAPTAQTAGPLPTTLSAALLATSPILTLLPLPPSPLPQARAEALGGSEEAETWAFLATHFAADGRRYLLERLGFSDVLPAEPEPEAAEAAPAEGGVEGIDAAAAAMAADAAAEQVQQLTLEQQAAAAAAAGQLLADDGADFFDKQSPTGAPAEQLGSLGRLGRFGCIAVAQSMNVRAAIVLAAVLPLAAAYAARTAHQQRQSTPDCPADGAAFFDNLASSTPPRPSTLSPRPGQPAGGHREGCMA